MPAVEYMQEQLDILARYVDAPRSLSVLEILGILLRAGFSPTLKQDAVSLAIDRVSRELETHEWSVDDECSLCTGRALSAPRPGPPSFPGNPSGSVPGCRTRHTAG